MQIISRVLAYAIGQIVVPFTRKEAQGLGLKITRMTP